MSTTKNKTYAESNYLNISENILLEFMWTEYNKILYVPMCISKCISNIRAGANHATNDLHFKEYKEKIQKFLTEFERSYRNYFLNHLILHESIVKTILKSEIHKSEGEWLIYLFCEMCKLLKQAEQKSDCTYICFEYCCRANKMLYKFRDEINLIKKKFSL